MNYPPKMMRRKTAAAYLDISIAGFEREVIRGNLPQPVMMDNKEYWYRDAIDNAVAMMAGEMVSSSNGAVKGTWRESSPLYEEHPDSKLNG